MEFPRELYLQRLVERRKNGLVKVITGTRRAGKSYLMNTIFYRKLLNAGMDQKHVLRFAFDTDEDLDNLAPYFPEEPVRIRDEEGNEKVNARKFRAWLSDVTNENEEFCLLLDEVQELDHFVSTINGLLRHPNFDVYVTGSNSKFLSSDVATEFRGRSSIIHVLPLTFGEYRSGLEFSSADAWKEYIVTGGIPVVSAMQTENEKVTYLKSLCEETYLKDIVSHNNIRDTGKLSDTFNILASVIGTPVNPRKISNTYRSVMQTTISPGTIDTYLSYFMDAFILEKVQKYNIKGRAYIQTPFKVYFEDIGVRNARLNFRQIEETHIMENIIFNELRYRGYNVDVGEMDINEKTARIDRNGKAIYRKAALEVDFIATLGDQKFYVQSALDMRDEKKEEQEKRSLYYIDDSFRKIIITKNGLKPMQDEKGVYTVDLFDFLSGWGLP